jgi:hypothetical protein
LSHDKAWCEGVVGQFEISATDFLYGPRTIGFAASFASLLLANTALAEPSRTTIELSANPFEFRELRFVEVQSMNGFGRQAIYGWKCASARLARLATAPLSLVFKQRNGTH